MNKILKNISIILILFFLIFIFGCGKKQNEVVQPVPEASGEVQLTPSAVPPTEEELVTLENGYQITTGLKLKIDQRCEASGLKGGDTGSGYGCVAS